MKRTVSGLAFALAALCIAPVSQAQSAPPAQPAPATAPAQQPAPPPGYPPPPPRYPQGGYQNPPPSYWAPAQPRQWQYSDVRGVYRPFSFTLGVGPGYLSGPEATREVGLSYNLFRLGFGIIPDLQFVLAFEGTGASMYNDFLREYTWLHQENWLVGLQWHVLRRIYLRGAVGAGFIGERSDTTSLPDPGTGLAMAGAIGYEFVQTPHVALGLEANGSLTKYAVKEYWGTAALNLAVSFF